MIIIKQPEVKIIDNKARLQSDIVIDGISKNIWFEVDEKYSQYLCFERADAFVIALLNYAMREGHDITCEAPMGEDLYYQITTQLIDAVYKGSKTLHNTQIFADVDSSVLPSAGAVGTGLSAGIDSFHAISQHSNSKFKNHNITHLAFNNVGSHGEGERAKRLYQGRLDLVTRFAKEYNYELVVSNSNLHDQIEQNHLLSHTYSSSFGVFCLQKLYSIYYYASSQSLLDFSLRNNEVKGTGFYDLLLLNSFSTNTLKILSEGDTLSRIEKTKRVAEYEPSYKYLNVCIPEVQNCGKCEKCVRTILGLYAIGKLDLYSSVFDVEYFKNKKQKYLEKLQLEQFKKHSEQKELYPYFKGQIKFTTKCKAISKHTILSLLPYIPQGLKNPMKKVYFKFKQK